MRVPDARECDFDIDRYLNRYIPPSQLHKLPRWISWWLGYRSSPVTEVGNILVWWWSLFGAFCGILVVGAVYRWTPSIKDHDLPVVFASLGASAILEYNTVQSPLAQPRNSIIGHSLSAIVGVGVAKLFMLRSNYNDIRWIAGAVCCGVSSAVMGMTNTIHPPGGATAILAAVDPTTIRLGWTFVPLIILGSILITVVGLLVNNIQRQFPVYWWTAKDVGKPKPVDDECLPPSKSLEKVHTEFPNAILIDLDHVTVPGGFSLAWEEERILHILRDRLRDQHFGGVASQQSSATSSNQTNFKIHYGFSSEEGLS